jgi:hypothetical protein
MIWDWMAERVMTEQELNRALLARQGLLEPMSAPVGDVVAAVGALQMQHWPALGPALWSRTSGLAPGEPHRAHAAGDLLTGTLLRGTIHTVTPGEYPAYAAVTAASKVAGWRRTKDQPGAEVADLQRELLAYAAEPRSADELSAFIESWVGRHPGVLGDAELAYQRNASWRPWRSTPWLLRVPADGEWGPKTPAAFQTAPIAERPSTEAALDAVVRCHLRGFGPAAAEDVAHWIGWSITPVRTALERMEDLVTFVDEAGRRLYDLPEAPRPDADTEAPVRLLPWFDSTLLAYVPKRRGRVLPDAYKDVVYVKANGQLKPTVLVDGKVAGIWSLSANRGAATLTLTPLQPLSSRARAALLDEAERLARFCHPDLPIHHIALADG